MLTFTWEMSCGSTFIKFSDKPSATIRGILKANQFRWSPTGGNWWKRGTSGAAAFIDSLQLAIDREVGIRRVDGPCFDCQAPEGYMRQYAARSAVLCDACSAKRYATDWGNRPAEQHLADMVDIAYEDSCARACGL